ncbi:Integrase core domain protein (modular protein) [Treponema phagedenis]|uniref:Integrase core domain protein (Modular protein) n=1 Tax=Treponema phagedenis TaxID=162 RepID=A0A0B7GWG5_TREPH|nr:Integrase core domain protein (modular protein) [Treponema phagedenis]
MDLYNREIVAYACSRHVDAKLAVDTVTHRAEKYSLEGVLLHSDQGGTYTSHAYREKLTELGMIQSMSRRGNCWDNACIENFFGTIKCESGYYDTLENGLLTYKQMEELIGKYIEFFNNERIQKNWVGSHLLILERRLLKKNNFRVQKMGGSTQAEKGRTKKSSVKYS